MIDDERQSLDRPDPQDPRSSLANRPPQRGPMITGVVDHPPEDDNPSFFRMLFGSLW